MAAAFSWKRACVHAALPLGAIVIGGLVFVTEAKSADPAQLGAATGKVALGVLAIALLVSFLAQTGRRTAAWSLGVGIPVAMAVAVIVAMAVTDPPVPPLTAAERAPLIRTTVAGEPRMTHPTFGFSLPDPGAAFVARDVTHSQLKGGDDPEHTQYYELHKDHDATLVIVSIYKGGGATHEEFDRFLDGMRAGLGAAHPARDDRTWHDDRGEAHLAVALDAHASMQLAAYAFRPHAAPPLVVVVMVIGDPATAPNAVLAGFTPGA